MTYGALNTATTANVEHAREAISDIGNVGLLNWERQSLVKNKWHASPMRYYGNVNVYFLERMVTHAVTVSVLVTRGHRFSLTHNILFCDQK